MFVLFVSVLYQMPNSSVVWRVWEEVNERHTAAEEPLQTPSSSGTDPKCAFLSFTVMSYNILAQDLLEAHQQLYCHCPLEVLDWSNRSSLLIQEMLKWMPDVCVIDSFFSLLLQ